MALLLVGTGMATLSVLVPEIQMMPAYILRNRGMILIFAAFAG